MLYGKSSEPVRLLTVLPFYTTDRYVQAEIYAPGTSSGGETQLTTVNLTHRAGGRYSAFYTPPENYDFLDVVYKVYEDSGYTTLDTAYSPTHEQLVLNGYSSGGGLPLNYQARLSGQAELDYDKLAERIWQYNLNKIKDKNSAGSHLKNIKFDVKPIIDATATVKLSVERGLDSLTDIIVAGKTALADKIAGFAGKLDGSINAFDTKIDRQEDKIGNWQALLAKQQTEFTQLDEKLRAQGQELIEILSVNQRFDQFFSMARFLSAINERLDGILASRTYPADSDFAPVIEIINKANHQLSKTQSQALSDFFENKTKLVLAELNRQTNQATLQQLGRLGHTDNKVKQSVEELKKQLDEEAKNVQQLKMEHQRQTDLIIRAMQNNIVVLAKMIKAKDENDKFNLNNVLQGLNDFKKTLR